MSLLGAARRGAPGPEAEGLEGFDTVIVGGGTAGAVVAARLSEDPAHRVCLIEAGPSDLGQDRVLRLRRWLELLDSDLDWDYRSVLQPRGNSHIRHARARVLGGCSSHNTMICFRPLPGDLADWEAAGATGWGAASLEPELERLQVRFAPVAEPDRNEVCRAVIEAASSALGVPVVEDFNAAPFSDGVGFLSVGYDPATGIRQSSSVAYLHPVLGRPNLTLLTDTRALRLLLEGDRAAAVEVLDPEGRTRTIHADGEIVLAAGAIDTPRLLLLSGIGPAGGLRDVGLDVCAELRGVGEHLLDHPEGIILWETSRPVPRETTMDADVGLFVNRLRRDVRPDLMYHTYQIPFTANTERLGYPVPEHAMCLTPNIPRPASVGRMWLLSSRPDVKPALDFGYFTDPDGEDERCLVDGLRLAREVAATSPFREWIRREVAPGPALTTDAELSAYGRASHNTVYHPVGTCRMGAVDDPLAVVDPELRVRGLDGLRIADASVFPTMPTVNPMVAVLLIGERAAALVAAAAAR